MPNRVKIRYTIATVNEADSEIKMVASTASLEDAKKLLKSDEFIIDRNLDGKKLEILIRREEPYTAIKIDRRLCPHCGKALDDETKVTRTLEPKVMPEIK